LAQRILKEKNN